ncbi:MAG: FAD:protein FMN transferase [Flavobacteriales bacterium]|nr:FAD:protein FMN transferase [Flavobacteriales bacterium]
MERPRTLRGFSLPVVAVVLLGACGAPSGTVPGTDLMVLEGRAQGTTFTIKYLDSLGRDLSGPVDSLLRAIDRSLSLWDTASTVSRFNAMDSLRTSDLHFQRFVRASRHFAEITGGAFDPSVMPLVAAWGFGPGGAGAADTTRLDSLRGLVGMERVLANDMAAMYSSSFPPEIVFRKERPGVRLDPNGIAQGHTVDVLAQYLLQLGITDLMVEVGGEVRAHGVNDRGTPWVMQIDKPVDGPEHVRQTTVPLEDRALATSGNYRKFREVGGRRFGHTIDPRSGRPVEHGLLSASVLAQDAASADAIGTALMVMGPEAARAWLADHPEFEAYLVMDDGQGGMSVWTTPGWPVAR